MSESDEDDWFERAIREADDETDGGGTRKDEQDATASQRRSAETAPGSDTAGTAKEDQGFSKSFDEAMQGAPTPDPGETTDGTAATAGSSESPFGGFESSEFPDDDSAFGEFEGFGGSETFDDTELDSDIDRIDIGIEGLDEMILGGVPKRSLITTIGSAGTGKTTFGLQFLNEALVNGGKGVYISLEESREAIIATAEEKGWPFQDYDAEGRLAVVAMDPIEMANSLASIRDDLSRLIDEFDADRLVLDSVSLLEMMYDHPAERRSEVFEFARSLKSAGVTSLLTSEASSDTPYASRHGIVEYLTDAVFVLQYVRPSDFRETRLAVEIQKIRDANHSRETKPYEITDTGISVYRQANIF